MQRVVKINEIKSLRIFFFYVFCLYQMKEILIQWILCFYSTCTRNTAHETFYFYIFSVCSSFVYWALSVLFMCNQHKELGGICTHVKYDSMDVYFFLFWVPNEEPDLFSELQWYPFLGKFLLEYFKLRAIELCDTGGQHCNCNWCICIQISTIEVQYLKYWYLEYQGYVQVIWMPQHLILWKFHHQCLI
jgi:hypothetical protein